MLGLPRCNSVSVCVPFKTQFVAMLAVVLFTLSFCPTALYSQNVSSGTVAGTVTDQSNAAVTDATVTLTDTATNIPRTTATNEVGRYVFANVTPGTYTVTINKTGFRAAKLANQIVNVGSSLTLNVALEIGATNEIIEVTATNAELQTTNATVGNTITGIALESLPSLGRDVSTFATLQPGVAPDGSVAGANQDQNSFMLDGGNNSSDMDGTQNTYTASFAGDPSGGLINNLVTGTSPAGSPGGGATTGVMPTPVDSIEEFKVGTTNQTADFNSSAGAIVQLITKRGTNQYHGTVYEYYLDNNWSGNTFDNNANGVKRPSYHYSHFGAAGGGPLTPKNILGGKTYIFANYEGFRFPNSVTVSKATPSDGLRLGLLQFGGTVYNLNPGPVTYPSSSPAIGALVPGTTYAGSGTTLDPLGLGISPTIQALWKFMPESNTTSCSGLSRCDSLNVLKFTANMPVVWNDNFGVVRLDHDFGAKWHFNSTYRYYHMRRDTTNQVDIGGFFAGDTLGKPATASARPQVPWYLTAGLTTNITTNLTNDFHYSFLRNYWARSSQAQPPQVAGLGGALEPFGESSTNVLAPFNLDTQSVRTRFWDGQDHMIRDDLSLIKGTHFFQFGGTYQRNWNYHQRTDNGGGINYQTVYWLGSSVGSTNGMDMSTGCGTGTSSCTPAAISAASLDSAWARLYGIALGVPGVTQIAYTRVGQQLTLNPPLTPAFDQSTIPFYNVYFSDSWRMKPTFTFNYGLGWTLEMPPVEAQGKQVQFVDQAGQQIDTVAYLNARKAAALQGQVYNPVVGFALVGNTSGGQKYPYKPFYGSFSPRIAAAWNPNYDSGLLGSLFGRGKTVIRGGFGILYGRLNGVDLVLVPLLGTGLIQAVQCVSPLATGACGGAAGATARTAFRIGPTASGFNGLVAPLPAASPTLPQPDFPGLNAIAAGAGEGIDPNFRPSMNYQFDLTVQRQINNKVSIEFGYIGRKITHEFQPIQVNSVPYMMTLGGQRFDKAYGQMVMQFCGGAAGLAGGGCTKNIAAVTPQPFFENALNSAYCTAAVKGVTPANCTQAVALNQAANIQADKVWTIWSQLDKGAFNFPRSMMNTPIAGSAFGASGQLSSGVGINTSLGWGNYNAAFVSLKTSDWHGLTMQSNLTYGKALGTGSEVQATSQYTAIDPFDLSANYGVQPWDRKFLLNTWFVYQPPFFKGQHGILGRVAGGWTISPLLFYGSGLPLQVNPSDNAGNDLYGGGQAFGEADGSNFGGLQNAILMCPNNFGSSRHDNVTLNGFGGNGFTNAAGTTGISFFTNPQAAYNCFRNPILGIDSGHNGGAGTLRGLPFYNVDLSVKKDIMVMERYHLEFSSIFTNVFNHNQMYDPGNPGLVLGEKANWGALEGQVNSPRKIEVGLRFRF
jgi:Carboxypeptidase regulatory-like domain